MKTSLQGKGLAAPDPKPSPSVTMANLTRLSVLVAESDDDQRRRASELLLELGVRSVVPVDGVASMLRALQQQAFDVLLCAQRLADDAGVLPLSAARKAAPATRAILMCAAGHAGPPVPADVEVIQLPLSSASLEQVLQRTAAPGEGLWCEVPAMSLTDILQMYHQAQRSIRILLSGPIAGSIRLESGEIVDAESADERGMPALSRLLEAETGLLRTAPPSAEDTTSIDAPFQSVLLEAAHKLDERRRDSMLGGLVAVGAPNDLTPQPGSLLAPGTLEGAPFSETSASSGVSGPGFLVPEVYPPSPESFRAPERRSRKAWLVAGALACVAGLAAVYVQRQGFGGAPADGRGAPAIQQVTRTLEPAPVSQAPVAPGSHSPVVPALEPAPAPAPPASAPASSFELTITSRPSRATVSEAGRWLGKTPFTLTIDAASVARRPRQFLLRLPGHFPYRITQAASNTDVVTRAVLSPRTAVQQPPVETPDGAKSEADALDNEGDDRSGSDDKRKETGIRLRR